MTYGDFFICWHHRHFLSSPTPPPGSKLFCFFLPLALRVFQTSNTWLKISRDDCYAGYWHDVRQPSDRRSDTRLNTSSNLDFESVLAKTQKFRSSVFTLPRNQTGYSGYEHWLSLWVPCAVTSFASRVFHQIYGYSGEIVADQELLFVVRRLASSAEPKRRRKRENEQTSHD